jgi:uncharacterized protein (DUF1015 family)
VDAIHARMPQLEPFIAAHPNPSRVEVAAFLAPPYDVISDSERQAFASQGANIVDLTLPLGENKYQSAARQLAAWLSDGTLMTADTPALFLYEQQAQIHGEAVTVRGLLANVKLDPPEAGGVKPHEQVYDRIVSDRLELLRATKSDLEPIIAIYDGDPAGTRHLLDQVAAQTPWSQVVTPRDGDRHRFWRIEDAQVIEDLVTRLQPLDMVIADGHHRWTTARKLAQEQGRTGSMMMLLQDTGWFAPALLAIHRVIKDRSLEQVKTAAGKLGQVQSIDGDPDQWAHELAESADSQIVAFDQHQAIRVTFDSPTGASPRDRLDIALLHERLFEDLLDNAEVTYAHTPTEVKEAISATGTGVLVRPTPLASVLEIASGGQTMPRKSTFFLPKPISGMVLRPNDSNRSA